MLDPPFLSQNGLEVDAQNEHAVMKLTIISYRQEVEHAEVDFNPGISDMGLTLDFNASWFSRAVAAVPLWTGSLVWCAPCRHAPVVLWYGTI